MKRYHGRRTDAANSVTPNVVEVEDADGNRKPLDPRYDLRNHSPDGFEWGYGGSGPAQLALAILADHLGDDERAQRHYQRYKFVTIGRITTDTWTITSEEVAKVVESLEGPAS